MVKKSEVVEEFAEKVAKFCAQNGLRTILRALVAKSQTDESKKQSLKALHFPTIDKITKKPFSSREITPPLLLTKPKQTKKISVDLLFRAKPLSSNFKSLYGAAYDTHKCCRDQDLHLYRHKQIYEQKRLSLKNVRGWKLPKPLIAKNQLNYYVDQMQTYKEGSTSPIHTAKMILVGEEGRRQKEDKARFKEQLELEKQLRERREYSTKKPTFN